MVVSQSKIKSLRPHQSRFLVLYVTTLLICFSPSKVLGQIAPLLFLGGIIFYVQLRPQFHLARYLIVLLIYTSIGCVYYFILPDFSFINLFLFLLTSSSILVLFADLRPILDAQLMHNISGITLTILVFESAYGILQGIVASIASGSFDSANGDNVRGTIEPSFISAGLGGNVMFAILISSLLILVLATSRIPSSMRKLAFYTLILIAWVIASVIHTILFFSIAVFLALLLLTFAYSKRSAWLHNYKRLRSSIIGAVILLFVVVPIVLPNNVSTIPYYLSYTFTIREDAYSEKARATYMTLFLLPKEVFYQPLIGVGPGHYSSRASMIRSGEYLRGSTLPLPAYTTILASRYILPLWRSVLNRPGQGSTYFPFYSWMSLYAELGLIGLLIACYWILIYFRRFIKYRSRHFPLMSASMLILLFYILLLGFQDNYWEFTQAIFPAMLALALCYNYLRNELDAGNPHLPPR